MGSSKKQSAKTYRETKAVSVQRHSVACAKAINAYQQRLTAQAQGKTQASTIPMHLCDAFLIHQ